MKVRPVCEKDYASFEKLFYDYYTELDCEDDPLHLFSEYVLPDLNAKLFCAAVAEADGVLAGFIIYQIDDVINDWNFKEGCGDVRELFVVPEYRRRGAGRALIVFAETALKAEGAAEVYTLPTDESEAFFKKCGYGDIGEYCAEADSKVFGKNLS